MHGWLRAAQVKLKPQAHALEHGGTSAQVPRENEDPLNDEFIPFHREGKGEYPLKATILAWAALADYV